MNLGQENETQEFKEGLAQLDKGLKSLSAMLNRSGEGSVYFGVKDDGEVQGLIVGKRTLLDIRSRAIELFDPRVVLDIDELQDESGRSYIKVHAEGTNVPYSCDGRYYLRTASADERIGGDLLRKILASGNADLMTQISAENQSLTFGGTISFLKERGIHAAETKEFLHNFGAYSRENRFNLLAYLLSDQNDIIIKSMRFAGNDKTSVAERMTFTNQSLLVTVQQVLDYFNLIALPKKVGSLTGARMESQLFDMQSFREAWINAVVHNSWTEGIPPSIYVYDNRLEVVSYGGLPFGLTEEGFFAGTSKPVNRRLFNIFITCDFSEQSGHGVPQIVKTYGREAFSFRDGLVVVTLPFGYEPDFVRSRRLHDSAFGKLTRNQRGILLYLNDHPNATLQEAAEACSLSLSGVKKIVVKLQEANMLARKGAKNRSIWATTQSFKDYIEREPPTN